MAAQEATRVRRLRQDDADAPMRMTTMQIAVANAEPNSGVVRRTSLWLDSLVTGNRCNVVTPLELSGCCWVTWSPGCSSRDPGWISVMCGRFTQSYTWTEVHEAMSLIQTAPNLRPRYNIAPTTKIDVVVAGNGERALMPMRWGLIPGWWKKPRERRAGDVQCSRRDRGDEADVSCRLQIAPMHHTCIWVLRMGDREGRQAAALFQRR